MKHQYVQEANLDNKVIRSILAIVFARLVINITKRFPYPFVSAIGNSFGVSANSIQNVIALTNGSGLLSPVLGTISGALWSESGHGRHVAVDDRHELARRILRRLRRICRGNVLIWCRQNYLRSHLSGLFGRCRSLQPPWPRHGHSPS